MRTRFWAVVLACAALALALALGSAGRPGLVAAETKPAPKRCIVTYRGKQYDLTEFNVTGDHPGGDLSGQCGKVVDTLAPNTHADDRMEPYLVKPAAPKAKAKAKPAPKAKAKPAAKPVAKPTPKPAPVQLQPVLVQPVLQPVPPQQFVAQPVA